MAFYIAYRENPDEQLYKFEKSGDTVSIGRDKKHCAIALPKDSPGVSRKHLKIECLSRGNELLLLANDLSTFGTGYNGNAFAIEKNKILKPETTLQVGSLFFVIKQTKNTGVPEVKEEISQASGHKRLTTISDEISAKKRKLTDNRLVNDRAVKVNELADICQNKSIIVDTSVSDVISHHGSSANASDLDLFGDEQWDDQSFVLSDSHSGAVKVEAVDCCDDIDDSKKRNQCYQMSYDQSNLSITGLSEQHSAKALTRKKDGGRRVYESQTKRRKGDRNLENSQPSQSDHNEDIQLIKFPIKVENEDAEAETEQIKLNCAEPYGINESNSDDERVLGMDLETLRIKLTKAVQFENLERPIKMSISTENSTVSCESQITNVKRFKKAAQGYHCVKQPLHMPSVHVFGVSDLIDFRRLKYNMVL